VQAAKGRRQEHRLQLRKADDLPKKTTAATVSPEHADLTNKSEFVAALVPAISPEGHTLGLVIVKATYDIDAQGRLSLAPAQDEILYADVMSTYADGIRVPSDFVDRKPAPR
jgi:hypothetical protein